MKPLGEGVLSWCLLSLGLALDLQLLKWTFGLRRRAQRDTPRLAHADRALNAHVADLARVSVGSRAQRACCRLSACFCWIMGLARVLQAQRLCFLARLARDARYAHVLGWAYFRFSSFLAFVSMPKQTLDNPIFSSYFFYLFVFQLISFFEFLWQ